MRQAVPDRVTAHRWPRRLFAALILGALFAELALLLLAHEAHVSRAHIEVEFSSENTIVQVFVECRVAYAFHGERAAGRSVDLGWLRKEDTLTFQVRSRKHIGFFALAYRRGSNSISLARRGSLGHLVAMPESRVVLDDSWTVGGEHLAALGCQRDSSALAFASPRARNWHEPAAERFELVTLLASVIAPSWAALGAAGLVAFAVAGRVSRGRWTQRTAAQAVFALAEIALALLASLAATSFSAVFSLCVVGGVGSLIAGAFWLLRDDLHRWTAPRRNPLSRTSTATRGTRTRVIK
jgi:hypothetical protein